MSFPVAFIFSGEKWPWCPVSSAVVAGQTRRHRRAGFKKPFF